MDAGIDMNVLPSDTDFYFPEGRPPPAEFLNDLGVRGTVRRSAPVSLIVPTFMNHELKAD